MVVHALFRRGLVRWLCLAVGLLLAVVGASAAEAAPVEGTATAGAAPVAETVRLAATEDSYVSSGAAGSNFGTSTVLGVDASPVEISYLKFDLGGHAGKTITGATLKVQVMTNGSSGEQRVKLAGENWAESTVTFDDRPALSDVVGTLGPTQTDTDYSVTLDPDELQAELGSVLSLGLDSASSDGLDLASREGAATPPTLELTLLDSSGGGTGRVFYVDGVNGSDSNTGLAQNAAWRSIAKVNGFPLAPGDSVLFARGQTFTGAALTVVRSGTPTSPIIVGAWGAGSLPVFSAGSSDTARGAYQPIEIRGSWVTVESVQAQRSHYAGIDVFGSDVVVKDCLLTRNPVGVEQDPTSSRLRIQNCSFVDNNIVLVGSGGRDDSGAMGVLLHGRDAEVVGCDFRGHRGPSPKHGFDGAAVEIYRATGANVHHNISIDDEAFTELGHVSSADNRFHHNVIINRLPGSVGMVLHGSGKHGPIHGTVFDHNTVYLTGTDSQGVVVGSDTRGTLVRNNIIQAAGKIGYTGTTIDATNNVYWGSTTNQIQGGAGNVTADPWFVAPADNDLHLQAGSPAVDKGGDLGYATDYDGAPRKVGVAPDAGGYEGQG